MRIEKTGENEIRVTVEPADQREYGIRYESMNFSDLRTRRFCERIALLVSARDRFPRPCERLTVRAVQGETGNLILYFSLPEKEDERCLCSRAVRFSSADALLDCRAVCRKTDPLCAEVYRWENAYYLWLADYLHPAEFDRLLRALSEFGAPVSADRTLLREHGQALPAAAVFLFSPEPAEEMFCKTD